MYLTDKAIELVKAERIRQNEKWGKQRHTPERWVVIAMEEIGEMCEAIQKGHVAHKEGSDADDLLTETVHATAVLLASLEQMIEITESQVQFACQGCPDPELCRIIGCDRP
jgi:NTP pyrophosphatase (non-canonical NTP hydrolase)